MRPDVPAAFRDAFADPYEFEVRWTCVHAETIGDYTCRTFDELLIALLVVRWTHFSRCDCTRPSDRQVAAAAIDVWKEAAA